MAKEKGVTQVVISPPKFELMRVKIIGEAPYMQNKFSNKTGMMENMANPTNNSKKNRPARNYEEEFKKAQYISTEGWNGMNAACIRNACISACRVAKYKMTLAKLALTVIADGYDHTEGTPLIRIEGTPELNSMPARNANGGTDVRVRPLWREWSSTFVIRYDADLFSAQDIINLLARAGMQVGIGEGRPDSRMSAGLGYGMFRVEAA
jgi:hypothetical protein